MRAIKILAVLTGMALGSMAGAEVTAPAFTSPMPNDAVAPGVNIAVMFANLQTVAIDGPGIAGDGEVLHSIWFDKGIQRQAYRATVEIAVPTSVPGLDTLIAVLGADVRLSLSSGGVPYAECLLPVQLISSRSTAIFELYLEGRGVGIKPHKGICDVNLTQPGIQIGIPQMHSQDLLEAIVWQDDTSVGHAFLEGYCY